MHRFILCGKDGRNDFPMGYISHNRIEVRLGIASPCIIQNWYGSRRADRDIIGSNANKRSMALVKLKVMFMGRSSTDQQETMEVSEFGEHWAWNRAKIGAQKWEEDQTIKEIKSEGYADNNKWDGRKANMEMSTAQFYFWQQSLRMRRRYSVGYVWCWIKTDGVHRRIRKIVNETWHKPVRMVEQQGGLISVTILWDYYEKRWRLCNWFIALIVLAIMRRGPCVLRGSEKKDEARQQQGSTLHVFHAWKLLASFGHRHPSLVTQPREIERKEIIITALLLAGPE